MEKVTDKNVRDMSVMLKNEAIGNGLCEKWTEEWKEDSTVRELADKFILGIDFCIKNRFPTLEQLRKFLPEVNEYGIFTDQKGVVLNNPSVAVFNGDCVADVNVDGVISTIWVRHNSNVLINVTNGGCAFVRIIDSGDVMINCGFFSKTRVFVYSRDAKLKFKRKSNTKIFYKYGFYDGKEE